MDLLVSTTNQGKILEFKKIFSDLKIKIISIRDIGFTAEVPETGATFEENAIMKAQFVGDKTRRVTLAEDSGLEIDALGGRPGVYSARYAKGDDSNRIHKVLEEMKGIPQSLRSARYKSVVALYDPKKKMTYSFDGVTQGYITQEPVGSGGFGYDPIFYSNDLKMTFSHAPLEDKNRVSHRGRAIERCKSLLKSYSDS